MAIAPGSFLFSLDLKAKLPLKDQFSPYAFYFDKTGLSFGAGPVFGTSDLEIGKTSEQYNGGQETGAVAFCNIGHVYNNEDNSLIYQSDQGKDFFFKREDLGVNSSNCYLSQKVGRNGKLIKEYEVFSIEFREQ